MDMEVLEQGKSTEAESTITDYAESILKWGNIIALVYSVINAMSAIITGCIQIGYRDYSGVGTMIVGVITAILAYFIIKFLVKLIWASIMLFVNISTTLKRIEIKLEENVALI